MVAKRLQEPFGIGFARTESDKERIGGENVACRLPDQFDPLLCGQSRDACVDRAFEIDRQSKSFEKCALAGTFSLERRCGKMRGQFGVGLRIPNVIIDAVRNADQTICTATREPIEPVSELGRWISIA
ncbi:MAG: hypothetical protein UZ17_ACD001002162 [Acidobacteria bacterium OLB17]|nr:MAG: hypothetical protein UZ17_ACD001002162 [Acidobacteria bacterium OLB17]